MQSACFQQVHNYQLTACRVFFRLYFFIVNIIIVILGKIQEIKILFQFSGRNIFPVVHFNPL